MCTLTVVLSRKTYNLLVQKSYIAALFLQYNFDEVLIARTAPNRSHFNPVEREIKRERERQRERKKERERVHAIANLELQSVGLMRKAMPQNMKIIMRNSTSNGIIKLCAKNNDLETELKRSLNQPKELIEASHDYH